VRVMIQSMENELRTAKVVKRFGNEGAIEMADEDCASSSSLSLKSLGPSEKYDSKVERIFAHFEIPLKQLSNVLVLHTMQRRSETSRAAHASEKGGNEEGVESQVEDLAEHVGWSEAFERKR